MDEYLIGYAEGFNQGRREGIDEGLQKATLEIAQRMFASRYSLSFVAEMTNLPEDHIKTLLKI